MEEAGQLYPPAGLPVKKNFGAHYTGACVGPRVDPEDFGEEGIRLFSSFFFTVI